ncbi:MAG: cation transporter [Gammaproteobacteria bacterium]|nr:cation transporter [Gammaproteobacteria bacterium]
MSKQEEHRLGVSEVNLVVRHLRLEPLEQTRLQEAVAEIDKIYGLDAISFDERTHVLNLAYDASRICLDGIEDQLKQYDVEVSHDWWTRFKESYYKFVDQNVKDNASHEPWSCHKRPPGK